MVNLSQIFNSPAMAQCLIGNARHKPHSCRVVANAPQGGCGSGPLRRCCTRERDQPWLLHSAFCPWA